MSLSCPSGTVDSLGLCKTTTVDVTSGNGNGPRAAGDVKSDDGKSTAQTTGPAGGADASTTSLDDGQWHTTTPTTAQQLPPTTPVDPPQHSTSTVTTVVQVTPPAPPTSQKPITQPAPTTTSSSTTIWWTPSPAQPTTSPSTTSLIETISNALQQTQSGFTTSTRTSPQNAAPVEPTQSTTTSSNDQQTQADNQTQDTTSFSIGALPNPSTAGDTSNESNGQNSSSSSGSSSVAKVVIPVVGVALVVIALIIWLARKRCCGRDDDDTDGIDPQDPDLYAVDFEKSKEDDVYQEDPFNSYPPQANSTPYPPPPLAYVAHQPAYQNDTFVPPQTAFHKDHNSAYYESTTYPDDSVSRIEAPPVPSLPPIFQNTGYATTSYKKPDRDRKRSENTSRNESKSSRSRFFQSSRSAPLDSTHADTTSILPDPTQRQSTFSSSRSKALPSIHISEMPSGYSQPSAQANSTVGPVPPQVRFAPSPKPSLRVGSTLGGQDGSGSSFQGDPDTTTFLSESVFVHKPKGWDAEVSSVYSR